MGDISKKTKQDKLYKGQTNVFRSQIYMYIVYIYTFRSIQGFYCILSIILATYCIKCVFGNVQSVQAVG